MDRTSGLHLGGRGIGVLIVTVMASGAMSATAATAPPAPAASAESASPSSDAGDLQEIVVTGSRIIRDGYQSPTPLTVVTEESLQQNTAGSNIAAYLNEMPAVAGSLQPQGNLNATQSGNTRVNSLALRNLGANRTLLLVDGQRVVSSTQNGSSDLNSIPQQLVSRVDIVTGGASAIYGSDAVAGVVNVVLNHKFTGVKLDLSGNTTSNNDNPGYDFQASAGHAISGGRGHFIVSAENTYQAGIEGDGGREWNNHSYMTLVNPAYAAGNGQPLNLVAYNVNLSNSAAGTMVTSGPLRGLAFGPGGTPYQTVFGSIVSNPYMVGGTNNMVRRDVMSLENTERRTNVLGRVEYDLTPDLNVFLQLSTAQTRLYSNSSNLFMAGSGPTIDINNPYLPASVKAQMVANNVTSLATGTQLGDFHAIVGDLHRLVNRGTVGIHGKYEMFQRPWTWEATYLYNDSRSTTYARNNLNKANFALAVDAVRNTAGNIVCRSTLTDPNNGCVPLNILGTGVATPEAIKYVTGTGFQTIDQFQRVFEANTQGDVFNNWAGPVSMAAAVAYRIESADTQNNTSTQPWLLANLGAMNGRYTVTEEALESVFPLLADRGFVRSWDLNGAARATNYSTSGSVTTWKLGSTFTTSAGINLRASVSHDIRAPGINELFSSNTVTRAPLQDPFTNRNPTVSTFTQGNASLKPEDASQRSFGVVLQPAFLPGFQASVDYWDISIKNAIIALNGTNVVNLCYQGAAQYCNNITRAAPVAPATLGDITTITAGFFNNARNRNRGIDYEASYNMSLLAGQFNLHANATNYLEAYVNQGIPGTFAVDNAGVIGQLSKWRMVLTASFSKGPYSASLTARGFTGGLYAPGAIECASSCPTSTVPNPTYNIASMPGAGYLDGSFTYSFSTSRGWKMQAFVNAKNIFNRDPALAANTNTYWTSNTSSNIYDYLGRVYRIGFRMSAE